MKLIRIIFKQLRHGEFLQLMKNLLSLLAKHDVAALNLNNWVEILSQKVQEFDASFQPKHSQELTADLKTLDDRRDNAIKGIRYYLQSMLYLEDSEKVAAATSLLGTMDEHGKRIDRLPYQQQTPVVHSLIRDFKDNPSLAQAMITVSLTDRVDLLNSLNDTFDTTYVERGSTTAEPAALEEKRMGIIASYNEFGSDLEAYARIAPNKEVYQDIIQSMNGILDDYKDAAQKRLSTNSRSNEEDINQDINSDA